MQKVKSYVNHMYKRLTQAPSVVRYEAKLREEILHEQGKSISLQTTIQDNHTDLLFRMKGGNGIGAAMTASAVSKTT